MGQTLAVLLYVSTYIADVCRFVATVGVAIIAVAVIAWTTKDSGRSRTRSTSSPV
jgi:predicted anti-sigma-YlaC factor YlaD